MVHDAVMRVFVPVSGIQAVLSRPKTQRKEKRTPADVTTLKQAFEDVTPDDKDNKITYCEAATVV